MTEVRKGQAPAKLDREQFRETFRDAYFDPAYDAVRKAIEQVEDVAWRAYHEYHKAPVTRKAGPGYADPDYDLSVEWIETRGRLQAADRRQKEATTRSRVLIVIGSQRNDGTCPDEVSKTWRMANMAKEIVEASSMESDVLDLSLLSSDCRRRNFPCKACVSTAMPLCHWPCSCYPNHALDQTGDWMAEIYERWVSAHGILLVTPVYWYQVPGGMKQMIDRLVCADGGNPDPTLTHGKDPVRAKQVELEGWGYPKHLAGRAYGVVVHGDVAGVEGARRALSDWLDWMGLIDAGPQTRLDRYIGYYEPYATSHDTLDRDTGVQKEVRNVARALVQAVRELRVGTLSRPDAGLIPPRVK